MNSIVLERRSRVLTLWQHRSTSLGWLFFFVVSLAGGFLCGLFLPLNNLGAAYTVSASVDAHAVARDICYWVAYLGLCFRYVPQILLSQARGRSLGLCIDTVIWNLFGNSCLFVSTLLRVYYLSPAPPATHGDARDVTFAVLAEAQCLLLLAQCWLLDGPSLQRPSPTPLVTTGIFVLLSAAYLVIMSAGSVDLTTAEMLSNWALVLRYTYICATLVRFFPQIARTRKYWLFFGWDAASLAMEALGGIALVLFILLGSPAAFKESSSSSRSGRYGGTSRAAVLGRAVLAGMDEIVLGAGVAVGAGLMLADMIAYPKVPAALMVGKRARGSRRSRGRREQEEEQQQEEVWGGHGRGEGTGLQGAAVEAWVLEDDDDENDAESEGRGAWAEVAGTDPPALTLDAIIAVDARENGGNDEGLGLSPDEYWDASHGDFIPPSVAIPLREAVILGPDGADGACEGVEGVDTWQTRHSDESSGPGTGSGP